MIIFDYGWSLFFCVFFSALGILLVTFSIVDTIYRIRYKKELDKLREVYNDNYRKKIQ
jgi:hypothetical protein